MKFLNRSISTIFIMLGSNCNFNCRYCMQHSEHGHFVKLPEKFNPDVLDFIEEVIRESDEIPTLQFYGGEPLVYEKRMRYIIDELVKRFDGEYDDKEGTPLLRFSVITNGSLLTDELVDYLNDHGVCVAISWDGKSSMNTRFHDVFADENQKAIILKCNNLSISGVLSSYLYPLELAEAIQEINNEYVKIHGYPIRCHADEVFDLGCSDRTLFDNIDLDRLRKEMEEIADLTIKCESGNLQVSNEEFNTKYYCKCSLYDSVLKSIIEFVNHGGNLTLNTVYCKNGYRVLNIDMQGNLYTCHNSTVREGTIYDDQTCYIDHVIENDNTKEYAKEQNCMDCIAAPVCKGGCKLIPPNVKLNSKYCDMKRAVVEPFMNKLVEIGKEVSDNG